MPVRGESFKPMTASTSQVTADVPAPASSTRRSSVVWVDEFRPRDIPAPEDYEDIDDVVARHETDNERRRYLEEARIALATREQDRFTGLAALRLRKGWSQKRLADEVGTSQPHIARLEVGHEDILMSTARRLATALGTSIEEINTALLSRGAPK